MLDMILGVLKGLWALAKYPLYLIAICIGVFVLQKIPLSGWLYRLQDGRQWVREEDRQRIFAVGEKAQIGSFAGKVAAERREWNLAVSVCHRRGAKKVFGRYGKRRYL